MVDQQKSPIGRRAVAKGIAWSVPAVALATAAPALAASPLIDFDVLADACKYPGESEGVYLKHAYVFPVKVTNNSNETVCLKAIASDSYVLIDGVPLSGTGAIWDDFPTKNGAPVTGETCLEKTKSYTYYLVVANTGDSAQSAGEAFVSLKVRGDTTQREYNTTVSGSFTTTPPKCGQSKNTATSTAEQTTTSRKSVASEDSAAPASAEQGPAEDTVAEKIDATAAEEPAASDAGGAEPAASDGGR